MLAWMSSLQSSVTMGPSGPVVVLAGEADAQSTGQLREMLVSQVWRGGRRLVVDVSRLRFVDSESVRVLVVAAKMLREQGGELVLMRPQTAVTKLLHLMGADQMITVGEPSDEMLGGIAFG
jgi:anti-sigma B factor antagonist